ncbi:hypothetical protein FOVSG1_006748 [Fusarium oxysporum f. sp. vasinfectum]
MEVVSIERCQRMTAVFFGHLFLELGYLSAHILHCRFLLCNSFLKFPGHLHLFLQRFLQPLGLPARLCQEIQRLLKHYPAIAAAAAAALSNVGWPIDLFFGRYISRHLPGFLRVSMAVSSNCHAVSRTLLVGFTRLGRFGVEKGASCSTTISAPAGSAMTVG